MSAQARWILHVDMDAFFCSVERLLNPALKGVPLVVGGRGPRSVVAAASYEARKFGIRSAMPMSQARRLCRNLVIAAPTFKEYSRLSKLIFNELREMAPRFQQVSVDEAYMDFTGCEKLYPSREAAGEKVKSIISKVSGLTSTVGIGTNKLIAKVASDFAKPNGLLNIKPGGEADFLAPLAIGKIPGVGQKTGFLLERAGVQTCGDLVSKPDDWLLARFGDFILDLRARAGGLDDREVSEDGEAKSIGSEETFEQDIGDMAVLNNLLRGMAEDIATELRESQTKARTIQIKIRYADFSTYTRARTVEPATFIARELAEVAQGLLKLHKIPGQSLRLLGMSVRNLVPSNDSNVQMDLFADPVARDREEKVERLKDELKRKFGKSILLKPT